MKRFLLLLPLALLGLYLTFFGQVNTAVYETYSTRIISGFQEQRQTEQVQKEAHPPQDVPFSELLSDMEYYNQRIAAEKQCCLTGPEVYEQAALHLEDYGIDAHTPVGTLSIPAIALELPIYLGASRENMTRGAAVLGQTSLPIGGEDTNCVLAGHRGYRGIPYFRNLDRLEPGDEVILTNLWCVLRYRVVSARVIEPAVNASMVSLSWSAAT